MPQGTSRWRRPRRAFLFGCSCACSCAACAALSSVCSWGRGRPRARESKEILATFGNSTARWQRTIYENAKRRSMAECSPNHPQADTWCALLLECSASGVLCPPSPVCQIQSLPAVGGLGQELDLSFARLCETVRTRHYHRRGA